MFSDFPLSIYILKGHWLLFCVCMYVACTCLGVDTHAVALVWRSEDDTECWSSLPTLFEMRSLSYTLLYMQTSWGSQDSSVSIPHFTIEESGLQMHAWPHTGPRDSNSGLHAYMASPLPAESSLKPKLIILGDQDAISTVGERDRLWKQASSVSRS